MPEITDVQMKPDQAGPSPAAAPSAVQPDGPAGFDHTKIKGRFNQYTSGYWVLALPLLGVRYLAEGINEIFEPLAVRKSIEKSLAYYRPIKAEAVREAIEKANQRTKGIKWGEGAWVYPVAATMLGVTGFYTTRTYGDMKRQFKEPLAWEFNKDPEKVGFRDMMKSKNTLIHDSIRNYEWRTASRFAAYAPFLTFLIKSPFKNEQGKYAVKIGQIAKIDDLPGPNPEEYVVPVEKVFSRLITPKGAVNLAVGTTSGYLASDALLRKRTFFEELQNLIDNKLNHVDRVGELVTSADLINLYDRQARYNRGARPLPKMNTTEWANDVKMFDRMADLMNQTYGNKPNTEQANFTVPKLIYMLGMHLLKTEDADRNMAYLEMANRYGIKEVEKVARIANGHGDLKAALARYPDVAQKIFPDPSLAVTDADNAMLKAMGIAPEPALPEQKSFVSENLKKAPPAAPAASQVDRLTQAEVGAGIGVGH